MKKALAIILCVALCVCLFAGCGSTSSSSSASTDSSSSAASTDSSSSSSSTDSSSSAPASNGKTYNWIVTNHDASTSMGEHWVEEICNEISEASGGRITFTFNAGGSLFGATEGMDAVAEGSADIVWSSTSFYSGRFPVTDFTGMFGNGIISSQMCGEVLRAMYKEMPSMQNEWTSWYPIAFFGSASAPVSTKGVKIESLDSFKGLQIRTAGAVPSQVITALGATPTTMSTGDVYESLEKGVIDGCTNDWHNMDCFKIYETVDYCMDYTISITPCFLALNPDSYNALDDELKAVIDKFSSGYADAMAGYYWDSCKYWVGDEMKDLGVDVYDAPEDVSSYLESDEVCQGIIDWYIGYCNDNGVDGQETYDACAAIVAKYADKHANDWAEEFNYADWAYDVDSWTAEFGADWAN